MMQPMSAAPDDTILDELVDVARRFPVRIIEMPAAEFTFGRALNIGTSQLQEVLSPR